MASSTTDTAIGVILIVVGAASLFGWLNIGFIVTLAAIAAIVVGVLVLMGKFSGSSLMGIVLLGAGILLLVPNVVGDALGNVLSTVAAVVLVVLGVLKLMGKW